MPPAPLRAEGQLKVSTRGRLSQGEWFKNDVAADAWQHIGVYLSLDIVAVAVVVTVCAAMRATRRPTYASVAAADEHNARSLEESAGDALPNGTHKVLLRQ